MSSRRMAWIAPALAAAFVVAHRIAYGGGDAAVWTFSLGFVVYAAVGGVIVDRYPRNPVGWLFCAIGVLSATGDLVSDYADRESGRLADALGVLNDATAPFSLLIIALALMLFPSGRSINARWGRAARVLIAANAVLSLTLLLGIDAPGIVVYAATLLTALASVVVRFRRARGLERQQLKWLALMTALGMAALGFLLVLDTVVNLDSGSGQVLAGVVLGMVSLAPAAAAAVAILRYRLYDVDVVINRALVYGALTALLGATYLGLVLLIGLAVGRSGFAVAVSTLAVAALFGPARARVQAAVDHRFYRRRYDAELALAGFGARLRDQVELDALSRELRGVVDECLQPAHVSLWLRAAP
jgi:hypothetical protein